MIKCIKGDKLPAQVSLQLLYLMVCRSWRGGGPVAPSTFTSSPCQTPETGYSFPHHQPEVSRSMRSSAKLPL